MAVPQHWGSTEYKAADIALVLKIVNGVFSPFWSWNKLAKDSKAVIKKPDSSSSSSSSNTDLEVRDGRKIRYAAEELILDPETGDSISSGTSTGAATSRCVMTIASNFIPLEFAKPDLFNQSIASQQDLDDYYLVILAGGYTGATSRTGKPASFCACLTKISGDVTVAPGTAYSFTFDSYKNTESTINAASITGAVFTPLTIERGGTGKDIVGLTPPTITEAQATVLLAGKPVFLGEAVIQSQGS
jgi:hypothetical protein